MIKQIQAVESNMNAIINQSYAHTISTANIITNMKKDDGSIVSNASSSLDTGV